MIVLLVLGTLIVTFLAVHTFLSRNSLIGKSFTTQETYLDASDPNRRMFWNSNVDFLKDGSMIITSEGSALNDQLHQKVIQYGRYGRPRHGNIDFILTSKYIVSTDNKAINKFSVKESTSNHYVSSQRGLSKIININEHDGKLELTQQNLKNDDKRFIKLKEIKQTNDEKYNERVQKIKQLNEKKDSE